MIPDSLIADARARLEKTPTPPIPPYDTLEMWQSWIADSVLWINQMWWLEPLLLNEIEALQDAT